jgi:amino acid adenylation domain-containing protein
MRLVTQVPLSSTQVGLWFLAQLHPASPQYNIATGLRLFGFVEAIAVRRAIRTLMDRHDALRLRIFAKEGEPVQELRDHLIPPVDWHDLRDYAAPDALRLGESIGSLAARAPFSLQRAPLFRVVGVHLPQSETLIVAVFHHIIADGWSLAIFWEELGALLAGEELGPPPSVRYVDYVAREVASQRDFSSQLQYWRSALSGEPPVLNLPKDRPRRVPPSLAGRLLAFSVPRSTTERLRRIATRENTTLFTVLLAAYKIFLARITGEADIVVGVPFAARSDALIQRVIGPFVYTLPLRTRIAVTSNFQTIVRQVRQGVLDAYAHLMPFERVVEGLKIPRSLQCNPLFQTLFTLEDACNSTACIGGLRTTEMVVDTATAKVDFALSLRERESGLSGLVEYSSDILDEATARRYVDMYVMLLDGVVGQPEEPVVRHSLLATEEKAHLIGGLDSGVARVQRHRTLANPFEEQVTRTPDAVAVVAEEGLRTYRELNERSNQLAHLLRSKGVRRGELVSVCMERSLLMVEALFGISKAGAAYVPLDPELPHERLTFMIGDIGSRLVLTHGPTDGTVSRGDFEVVDLDKESGRLSREPVGNLSCDGPPNHLAYLLYTSGSTGRPKAVAYPTDASLAFMLWMQDQYPLGVGDAQLFKTPFTFDVSVWELFWTLYTGARLIVCRPGGHRDTRYLAGLIEEHCVTAVNFVPSMLQAFLDDKKIGPCSSVRWVFCGGETLTPRLRDACHLRLGARLVNVYGPTEAGTVTHHPVEPDDASPTVPLGKSTAGYRLYVLDDELNPAPIGVPGELYVGGKIGLAHGYHQRPDLTADRFLPDPFGREPGSRMYRTGDICRYTSAGLLEHLGRSGTQVKLRGIRVELQEIEAVLCEHRAVSTSVVLAHSDDGNQRLLAFVVPRPGIQLLIDDLVSHAARVLPRFMVPSSIVVVEEIPTTMHGKLNASALIDRWNQARSTATGERVAPVNDVEEKLAGIFGTLLGIHRPISVTESFFDLGGHSLLALKLVAACEDTFGFNLPVAEIFSAPTVRALASVLGSNPSNKSRTCLVPLAASPDRPIMILVHPASGSVLCFVEVIKYLRDAFAIYGLQAPGIDDEREPLTSIQELAELYVSLLDPLMDQRPLLLVGYSLGGNVALEMGRRLLAKGAPLSATVLIDSWAGNGYQCGPDETDDVLALLRQEGALPAEVPASQLSRVARVLKANLLALKSYRLHYYDSSIDLVRAREPLPPFDAKGDGAADDLGWGDFVRHVAVYEMEANHLSIMEAAQAPRLADILRAIAMSRLALPCDSGANGMTRMEGRSRPRERLEPPNR